MAILLYVTLDLSVAWMPGAFVFDAANTVESVRTSNAQETLDTITVPSTPRLRFDRPVPETSVRRTLVTLGAPRPEFRLRGRELRDAPVEVALPSTDDPH